MAITSPEQLPQLIEDLKRQRFYGDLHLKFRGGHLSRIITEQSQIFDDQREGTRLNDNYRQ
jgi:hypothetical protein